MKKYILPLALLVSWVMTSCSPDEELITDYDQDFSEWSIDGIPLWLQEGFDMVWSNVKDGYKYYLSSESYGMMQRETAKIHVIDGKQYISLCVGIARDRIFDIIVPEKFPDNEELLYNDASTDIRKLGYYDFSSGCFTPGGKAIADEKLIEKILLSSGRVICHNQYRAHENRNDILYGFEDLWEWIKPHFAESLKSMCQNRCEQYGEKLFLGSIDPYRYSVEGDPRTITDEDTNGRGTPFILETYIMNDDHSLTRYIESFIADEEGQITPLPFDDIKEIASRMGISEENLKDRTLHSYNF